MKILVTTALDGSNLSVENIIKELVNRGHYIEIFAQDTSPSSIRMFIGLGLLIRPIKELTKKEIARFDVAFCGADAMRSLRFSDIYIFSYNYLQDSYHSEGVDFLFNMIGNRRLSPLEDCAMMAIGNAKNDTPLHSHGNNHQFLYIDAGHNPFGEKGKKQVANMLLDICKKFPNYNVVVKPRWLLDDIGQKTHKSGLHIYNILLEITNNNLPNNLILLNEYKDLQELIDDSDCVITTSISCYIDVAIRGKGVIVLDGFDGEEQFETRRSFQDAYEDAQSAGCCVSYKDVTNFLPYGIQCNTEYMKKRVPYFDKVSEKIVDVMEYVYNNFIKQQSFPTIQEYDYGTFRNLMTKDKSLNITELKYKRFKNSMLYSSAGLRRFKSVIDYSSYYNLLENIYHNYSLNEIGFKSLSNDMLNERRHIIIENREKCMSDAIDQSLLLQNLYDTGHRTEILQIPEDKILCKGPYYYYLGMIAHQNKDFSSALYYLHGFLKEANARSFEKYPQEQQWGIKNAYIRIINMFNGTNLTPKEYAELYENLYTKKNPYSVPFRERSIMHNAVPKVCEQLVEMGEEQLALRCLLIRAKEEWRYRGDSEVARIKNSKEYKLGNAIAWLPRKMKGGLRCLKENGFKYTVKLAIKKIVKKVLPAEIFQIRRLFKEKILLGFSVYSRIVRKYGENTFIHLISTPNGDTYLAFQYYKNYIATKFRKNENVVVSSAERILDLSEWFDIENAEKILKNEYLSLISLYVFVKNIPIDILHYHLAVRHTVMLMYLEGLHNLNFMDMLQEVVFSGIKPCKPVLPNYTQEIEDLFTINKLQIGKTVMLSPFANSVAKIPLQYWLALSNKLSALGFSVCTNAVGTQIPIIGTKKIELPYQKMETFLNMAGYLVSCRSGLDDITHDSLCKRVEVYAEKNWTRSLVVHMSKCYAYSDNYVLVSENSIDECVEQTLNMLGID